MNMGIENQHQINDASNGEPQASKRNSYQIQVGNERLEYRPLHLSDPVPTGEQILEAAEALPTLEHTAFMVLRSGLLEELRPDETVDLRGRGVEKFLIFRSDRSFRFELDRRVQEWGASRISGLTLKKLANVAPDAYDAWLEVQHAEDRLIEDGELFDLSAPGVERFYTQIKAISIIVNGRPKTIRKQALEFLEVVRLAFPDAVINDKTEFTVVYKRGPQANPEGSMVNGNTVQIQNGMVFNVTPTDKS